MKAMAGTSTKVFNHAEHKSEMRRELDKLLKENDKKTGNGEERRSKEQGLAEQLPMNWFLNRVFFKHLLFGWAIKRSTTTK